MCVFCAHTHTHRYVSGGKSQTFTRACHYAFAGLTSAMYSLILPGTSSSSLFPFHSPPLQQHLPPPSLSRTPRLHQFPFASKKARSILGNGRHQQEKSPSLLPLYNPSLFLTSLFCFPVFKINTGPYTLTSQPLYVHSASNFLPVHGTKCYQFWLF